MDPKIVPFDVALKSTERQWVQKIPEVYTNDLGSVSIQFKITDCTDTELTGSTAIVLLKMRDGSFFQGPTVDVTRTLNVFSYTLKENEGNHDGLAEIQLIVTIDTKKFATQKYNFKVISGLDSEVAREIMIYDWSILTAEARAYIDQFTADEILRDAEFDNAQFDRNVEFNAAQGQRATDFGLAQTQRNTDFETDQAQRVSDFNAAEASRVLAFNNAEAARAAGYVADHSRAGTDHTGAVADRANATTDRTNAATDRTNAAADRTLAGTDHTRAESDHTTALSDHAVLGGYNGRLTDVETLHQKKANKLQEDWITPTLLNGWAHHATYGGLKYYKDEFGIVTIKGTVSNSATPNGGKICPIPVGYRPEKYIIFITPQTAGSTLIVPCFVDQWGNFQYYGTPSNISINLQYKAEV